jgi:hypothetical protein
MNECIKELMHQIPFHHGQGKKEMDSDKLIHAVTDRSSSLHITVQSKSD